MKNNRALISATCLLGMVAVSSIWYFNFSKYAQNRNLTDEALLALIKNDLKGFEKFIAAGGDIHSSLPEIDGETYTVAQGLSYFERTAFARHVHDKKISYVTQDANNAFDIMTLSVKKNNPELLNQLALENPKFDMAYGKNGWNLLHMASAQCSHKLTAILHEKGKLNWNQKAKDGSTPLTLAAENDCLPMLSYWKNQKADFKAKDGRGLTALSILKKKKDPALLAFAESFEERKVASIVKVVPAAEPDFYKKRKIPKDQIVDHAAMIEPGDRPLEATETSELSEFAD